MALFVQQNDNRTKLQEQIAAELQEKARKRGAAGETVDGVDDSRYLEGTKRTTSLAGVWVAIIVLIIAVLVYFAVRVSSSL